MTRTWWMLAVVLAGCADNGDFETLAGGLVQARGIAVTPDHVFVRTGDGIVRVTKDGGDRQLVHPTPDLRLVVRDEALYFTDSEGVWICVGDEDPVLLSADFRSQYHRFDVEVGRGGIWFPSPGRIRVLSVDDTTREAIAVEDRIGYVHDLAIVGDRMLYAGDDDTTYLVSLTDGDITSHALDAEYVQRNDTDFYLLADTSLLRLSPEDTEPYEVTSVDAFSSIGVGPLGAVVTVLDAAGERGLALFRANDDASVPVPLPDGMSPVTDAIAIDDEAVYVLAREDGTSSDAVLLRIVPEA